MERENKYCSLVPKAHACFRFSGRKVEMKKHTRSKNETELGPNGFKCVILPHMFKREKKIASAGIEKNYFAIVTWYKRIFKMTRNATRSLS